jgi:hypothetical protein
MAALGLASGLLSVPLADAVDRDLAVRLAIGLRGADTVPGLVFGIVIGVTLRRLGLFRTIHVPLFALAAAGCYHLAFNSAIGLAEWLEARPALIGRGSWWLAGAVAGGVGGGSLAALLAIMVPALRDGRRLALLVLVGAAGGVLLQLLFDTPDWGPYVFFGLWQGAYAGCLAAVLPLAPAAAAPSR